MSLADYSKRLAQPLNSLFRWQKRPPVGAAPGTMLIHESAPHPNITLIHFDENQVEEVAINSTSEIEAYRKKPGILWINVDTMEYARNPLVFRLPHDSGFHGRRHLLYSLVFLATGLV